MASQGISHNGLVWRSSASSALTMVATLAMIRHYSKTHTADFPDDNGSRGGRESSTPKPRVDMVS